MPGVRVLNGEETFLLQCVLCRTLEGLGGAVLLSDCDSLLVSSSVETLDLALDLANHRLIVLGLGLLD